MNLEEAKARVAAEDAELKRMESEVARLAQEHPTPVFLALLLGIVETVCASHGAVFRNHYKLKLYRDVIALLHHKGIA